MSLVGVRDIIGTTRENSSIYQKYYSTVFLADLFLGGIIFIIGLSMGQVSISGEFI